MPKILKLNTDHIKALAQKAWETGELDEMSDALISDAESLYLGYNENQLNFVIYNEDEDKVYDDYSIVCLVTELVSDITELATNEKEKKAILNFAKRVYANDEKL